MSGDGSQTPTARRLTRGQQAVSIGVLAIVAMVWFACRESPIPGGDVNSDKAKAFLTEQFPDREVTPYDNDRRKAPVAVVYELIRSGKPEVARRAIGFAAEQRFGYAAPYAIERLGSGDPELERAAQDFLREVAGDDYGPDAESWREWWRNPPRKRLGIVPIGQMTVDIGIPAIMAFAGAVLLVVGRMGPRVPALLGPPLLVLAWFLGTFSVASQLGGGNEHTCTFGSSEITYYVGHGTVVGLEDARIPGIGLQFLFFAVIMIGGLALLFACSLLGGRWEQAANVEGDGKTTGAAR